MLAHTEIGKEVADEFTAAIARQVILAVSAPDDD